MFEYRLSPITVREQRVGRAHNISGLSKEQRSRGDQSDRAAAEDQRTTGVPTVLQLLRNCDDSAIRKALQRLHVKWYHREIGRLQSIFRAAVVPPRACKLVPQVVQGCQVCRPWRKPSLSNKFIYLLALSFHDEAQFDFFMLQVSVKTNFRMRDGHPRRAFDRLLHEMVRLHQNV